MSARVPIQVFSPFFDSGTWCGSSSSPYLLAYDSDILAALDHVYGLREALPIAAVNMSLGGAPYGAAVAVTGGVSPVTCALTPGPLPEGLTLDAATGIIAGRPTLTDAQTLTVEATDATSTSTHVTLGSDVTVEEMVLYDDLEDSALEPWNSLHQGEVTLVEDLTEGRVLRKTTQNHPNGDRELLSEAETNVELVVYERKTSNTGGDFVRYGLTYSEGNGLRVHLNAENSALVIQRRNHGRGTRLRGNGIGTSLPVDYWDTTWLRRQGSTPTADGYAGRTVSGIQTENVESLAVSYVSASTMSQLYTNGGNDFETSKI